MPGKPGGSQRLHLRIGCSIPALGCGTQMPGAFRDAVEGRGWGGGNRDKLFLHCPNGASPLREASGGGPERSHTCTHTCLTVLSRLPKRSLLCK